MDSETDTTSEEDTIRISDRDDNDVPPYEELIAAGAADAAQQKKGAAEATQYMRGRSQEKFFYDLRQMYRAYHLIYTYQRQGPALKKDAEKIGLSYKKVNLFARLQGIRSDIEAIVEKERRAKGDNYKYPTISMMESWLPDHQAKAKPVLRKIMEAQIAYLQAENATLRAELELFRNQPPPPDDDSVLRPEPITNIDVEFGLQDIKADPTDITTKLKDLADRYQDSVSMSMDIIPEFLERCAHILWPADESRPLFEDDDNDIVVWWDDKHVVVYENGDFVKKVIWQNKKIDKAPASKAAITRAFNKAFSQVTDDITCGRVQELFDPVWAMVSKDVRHSDLRLHFGRQMEKLNKICGMVYRKKDDDCYFFVFHRGDEYLIIDKNYEWQIRKRNG